MMNKNVPFGVAATILTGMFALIGYSGWTALRAGGPPAPRRIDAAYCTRCHAGAAGLKALKRKEGNTHFLFHDATKRPSNVPSARVCPRPSGSY